MFRCSIPHVVSYSLICPVHFNILIGSHITKMTEGEIVEVKNVVFETLKVLKDKS